MGPYDGRGTTGGDEARRRDVSRPLDGRAGRPGDERAVLDGDGIRYATGLGARDVQSRAPATAETLYSIASVTKTFTAMAVSSLVERDELALDDEIRATSTSGPTSLATRSPSADSCRTRRAYRRTRRWAGSTRSPTRRRPVRS
ncbi:hypothetical protein BRC81_12360 [Halobacteriales archaeon QS_1_68_20]|nr:MAG: hypothetical protein BRC81_12360 [Halobacteriales archaeon QS_1_68_20]